MREYNCKIAWFGFCVFINETPSGKSLTERRHIYLNGRNRVLVYALCFVVLYCAMLEHAFVTLSDGCRSCLFDNDGNGNVSMSMLSVWKRKFSDAELIS